MGRGRPRKSAKLKLMEGSHVPCRDGDEDEIVLADGVPSPPYPLKGEALKHWNELVPRLTQMGVSSEVDSHSLALMCQAWASIRKLQPKVDKEPDGPARMPWLGFTKQWVELASRFGLTPSDRAKLRIERPASSDLERKYG